MKVMIFVDYSNFMANMGCIKEERSQDRVIEFYRVQKFVMEYLSKNPQYRGKELRHVRTYVYTGEYTDSLFKRIKDAINESTGKEKEELEKLLEKTEKRKKGQKKFFKESITYAFFEIRKKPLQFTKDKGIFQKGVDVQMAVDLVSNAYLNNYDIAVLFSGDIDLLESLKLVKSLGKHVILFSHYKNIAQEMIKESDLVVDFQKVNDEILDRFSHIFEEH